MSQVSCFRVSRVSLAFGSHEPKNIRVRDKVKKNLIPGLNTRGHFSENVACDLKMHAPWEVILVKVLPAVKFHNREFVQASLLQFSILS